MNENVNSAIINVCQWFGKYGILRKIASMNEFLEGKQPSKFGVVMTLCYHVIFTIISQLILVVF